MIVHRYGILSITRAFVHAEKESGIHYKAFVSFQRYWAAILHSDDTIRSKLAFAQVNFSLSFSPLSLRHSVSRSLGLSVSP